MFERIKLRIIQGRKLKPFEVAKVLQEHEDRLKALEVEETTTTDTTTDTTTTTRDISFTINDGTDPISGASVKIGSTTKTTGSAGGCNFTAIEEGSVSVEVSKTGFTTKTQTITVDSTHTSFTISLVAE